MTNEDREYLAKLGLVTSQALSLLIRLAVADPIITSTPGGFTREDIDASMDLVDDLKEAAGDYLP